MVDWTTISDSQVDPNAPITSELMTALRDNPIAIVEGAVGAPNKATVGATVITTSGSYTIPSGYNATIVALGAGGSGGLAVSEYDSSAGVVANGGGAGAVCVKKIKVTGGDLTLTVTIGSGGATQTRGGAGATVGNAGGTTTVTATGVSVSAGGGGGGTSTQSYGTEEISAGAVSGGNASGGDINKTGGGVGVSTKTSGSGAWGNGCATPFESIPASSGRRTPQTSLLTDQITTVGLTDALLFSGQTHIRSSTTSSAITVNATDGSFGHGGGGVAAINEVDNVIANSGAGGNGAVYLILEEPF